MYIYYEPDKAQRSIPTHSTFDNDGLRDLDLRPKNINRVHPLSTVYVSANFEEEAHNG